MKPGDLVRVKVRVGEHHHQDEKFSGIMGVIIAEAKRLRLPAYKVLISGEMVEFDEDELEVINEDR